MIKKRGVFISVTFTRYVKKPVKVRRWRCRVVFHSPIHRLWIKLLHKRNLRTLTCINNTDNTAVKLKLKFYATQFTFLRKLSKVSISCCAYKRTCIKIVEKKKNIESAPQLVSRRPTLEAQLTNRVYARGFIALRERTKTRRPPCWCSI